MSHCEPCALWIVTAAPCRKVAPMRAAKGMKGSSSSGFSTLMIEAALSFLGLGTQPPDPSWGLMISEGKGEMLFKSWMIVLPGGALFAMVLAVNMLGDGIRDVTAPENRN